LNVIPRRAHIRTTAVMPCAPPPVTSTRERPATGALAVGDSQGKMSDPPGSG